MPTKEVMPVMVSTTTIIVLGVLSVTHPSLWNEVLCRGPDTLGKEAFALGKCFADSCSR
jgi:hypothetical protein